jgi:hypothetical protein
MTGAVDFGGAATLIESQGRKIPESVNRPSMRRPVVVRQLAVCNLGLI